MIALFCTFCGKEISKGRGILFAKKDGTLYYFCSSKCKKNFLNLGREGRRVKWTESYRRFKQKSSS